MEKEKEEQKEAPSKPRHEEYLEKLRRYEKG
jgi:hypothetical protein